MSNKAQAHLIISGKVQGVYFRGFTAELATRLGLTGWVKNIPSRQVEAVFEGDKEVIEEAIKQCYIGPPLSKVTNIEVTWSDYTGSYKTFEILYR